MTTNTMTTNTTNQARIQIENADSIFWDQHLITKERLMEPLDKLSKFDARKMVLACVKLRDFVLIVSDQGINFAKQVVDAMELICLEMDATGSEVDGVAFTDQMENQHKIMCEMIYWHDRFESNSSEAISSLEKLLNDMDA